MNKTEFIAWLEHQQKDIDDGLRFYDHLGDDFMFEQYKGRNRQLELVIEKARELDDPFPNKTNPCLGDK